MKSIIVFAVLDDGSIHQVLLDKDQNEVIKSAMTVLCEDTLKVSSIDFSEVIQLPEDE